MRKTILTVLLIVLLPVICFLQNNCFEEYEIPAIPQHKSDPIKELNERFIQFVEFIKDCKAPDFKLATIDGDTIELKKLKGKVVVLNFWFIECAPCIAEIPALNKLAEEYKSEEIVFIAPSRSTKKAIVDEFLPEHTFMFRIVPDCKNMTDLYKVYFGWPMTYVLDKKGKVKFVKVGGKTDESAKTEMYEILKPVIDGLL